MEVTINKQARLSEHFTLAEMCKTSAKTQDGNIPSHVHIENLKHLCGWLEKLRERYNRNYVLDQTTPAPPNSGGEASGRISPPEPRGVRGGMNQRRSEEPIIINSGYRSEAVNKVVGGVPSSNHLTGCAVDIHVENMQQLLRYAVILLDIADESKEAFDELLIEKNTRGVIWLHFAVRPKNNRMRIQVIH